MTTLAYSAISSGSRVELLHLLQQRAERTIAELCEETGLHANTVREHLQRLTDGGYVVSTREHRTTRGRPRVLYSAAGTPSVSSPIARRRVRDAARRGDLMRRVMPDAAPSADLPEDAVHQLDALTEDLAGAGFDPFVDERELTIDLSPCAHAPSDPHERAMKCSVHLQLMQSVLTEAGGPLSVSALRESCDPTQCVVMLLRN
ncbi:winged helix-turn-helix domain-containing protein [Microbacterium sp. NPDC019599]|uniref:winged helix-turn-helix domain-containing protein n=1 Tax=Microbacterium sp. NPDC019599 TaxID=3154690 RepID=UPI0033EA7AF4